MIVTAGQSDLVVCYCNENATINSTENSNRRGLRHDEIMQIEGSITIDKCLLQDTEWI